MKIGIIFFVFWLLSGVSPTLAQTETPTPQTQRIHAHEALSSGNPRQTVELAKVVLSKAPDDFQMLILLSLAHTELGQHKAAAAAAQRAFRAGRTSDEKLQATRLVAGAKYNTGQYIGAEWWLRKGANHANSPENANVLAKEFHAVRQRNPLRFRIGFSVAPSNNINGGTEAETFTLGDYGFIFDPSSRALSGIEYSGDAQLSYRLSESSEQLTKIGLYIYGRTYSLSSTSQDEVPDAVGSDYSLGLVELSLDHRRMLFDGLGPTTISLHSGQVWYGGEELWRYNKLAASQNFPIGQDASATLGASVEKQVGLTKDQPDTTIYELQAVYAHLLANQDILRIGSQVSFQ